MERQTYQRKKNMLSCNVLFVSLDEVEACLNLNLTTLGDKLRVRKTKKVNKKQLPFEIIILIKLTIEK